MKVKELSVINKLKAGLLLALFSCSVAAPPPAQAVLIENLPIETQQITGFTHRAIVLAADLTTSANTIQTVTLLPSGTVNTNLGTNTIIGPVAFVVSQMFTNNIANNTNLLMYIGVGGGAVETGTATNSFFSAIDIDGRSLQANQAGQAGPTVCGHTNLVLAVASGSNNLVAVFKQAGGTPLLSGITQGKVAIYFRAIDMNILKP